MKTSLSIAVAGALLLASRLALGSDLCPTANEIVAGADRTEDLLLEFARAYGRSAGLPELRKLPPSPGVMHVRLWHGFGLTGVDGLVLSRTGAMWTAHVLAPVRGSACYERREVAAVTNWGSIWRNIEALGLGALPSRPTRDPNRLVADGYSYVLEWWLNGRYRAFVYDNPDVFKTGAARRSGVRNKAFHAEWAKIDRAEVHSVIAFVQEFVAKRFSGGST